MKIFIPCAGVGSRLQFLTKNLNKSLVSVKDKPAISHIIDKFSEEHTFVIAVGYKGNLLKQFLKLAYPKYKFEFIEVNNYEDVGSGLGLTIKLCKEVLQEPFLFIPTDSLFDESEEYLLSDPDCIFFADNFDEEFQYRKIEMNNGYLYKLTEKSQRGICYTGLCYIKSYEKFWDIIDDSEQFISDGESYILNRLCKDINIKCKKLNWHDIGNLKSLEAIKKSYLSKFNILDKENESIWFLNDTVIKYHNDLDFISNRVLRFNNLQGYVPKLISHTVNMYSYEFVVGETLSTNFDLNIFQKLLDFLDKFWYPIESVDIEQFKNKCLKFYKNKTLSRIAAYKNISQIDCNYINGIHVGDIDSILNKINWEWLSNGAPVNFHGDLHFENIIKTNDSFSLIDWRQEFEGQIEYGDIYYDFAKLLHGMIIAHDIIKLNYFNFKYSSSDAVNFDFYIKNINILAQEQFFEYLTVKSFDIKKVKILTALIFLNIAALHHEPYNHLLYYLGKFQLYQILKG